MNKLQSLEGLFAIIFNTLFFQPMMFFQLSKKMASSGKLADNIEIVIISKIAIKCNNISMF